MTAWDPTLPQFFERNGFQEESENNVLKTSMEYGPPKRRRRTTTNVRTIRGTMIVSSAQRTTLNTFYYTTVAEVESFTFPDPYGGPDLTVKFDAPPTYSWRTPNTWRVQVALEVQP